MGDPAEAAEVVPKRGKGKLIFIVGLAMVLLATMTGAFLYLRMGAANESEYGPAPAERGDTFMTMPQDFTVMLPDGVNMLSVTVTLQVSPRSERGYDKKDAKEELETLNEDNADKTKLPLVRERIGIVLASKTKQEWLTEIGQNQIKTMIANELNSKVLRKGKVEQVIFSTPPLIQ